MLDALAECPGLVAAGRGLGRRLALLAPAGVRLALAFDAGWLVMPAALGLGEDPRLLDVAAKLLEGDLKGIAVTDDDLRQVRSEQPGRSICDRPGHRPFPYALLRCRRQQTTRSLTRGGLRSLP